MADTLDRREFIRTSATAGAGLVIAVYFPWADAWAGQAELHPAAWLTIDPDGVVTVIVDEAEMGQGVMTALPMIIAEELEADWSTIRVLGPPENPAGWVRNISTGGSTSVRHAWDPFRKAGAAAREMLRTAAAEAWGVDRSVCRAENGAIVNGDRRATYGELAERAAALPVPEDPPLKDRSDYTVLGGRKPRVDMRGKVDGTAVFGTDVEVDGMLMASVEHPPAFCASVASLDDAGARRVDGVVDVVQIPQGVAVVARNTFAALEGRRALRIAWDMGPNADMSTASLFARCEELARSQGEVERDDGDVDRALRRAGRTLEATYRLPFLDHATMETMNCTARVRDGAVEVWAPTQVATAAQRAAAQVAGVEPEDVVFHVTLLGSGFGRRLQVDYVVEAVEIAKRIDAPVQLFWTREDTTRNGAYRPLTYHTLRGGIDGGRATAWHHRLVGTGSRGLVVPGAHDNPYAIPNLRVDYHLEDWGIPLGAWRSVAYTQNGFVVESFIDELAHAAGADPFEFRRELLRDELRLRGALELAAERAGWGERMPDGKGRGIAAVHSYGSWVAEVADVTVADDGSVTVDRVVCGVDCGQVINPYIVEAQMQSAVTLALGYTFKHAITIEGGGVVESNFTDYPILRIDEMPAVEVYFVQNEERPGGIGEPGVPPLSAAVANAIFDATGVRVREQPITPEMITG